MRQYSGGDPDTVARQILLKINFVIHAWPDTHRKLEKLDGWQERGLEDLLREVQRVYIRRDEEKAEEKARVMLTAIKEGQFFFFYCKKNEHFKRNCRQRERDPKVYDYEQRGR